MVSLFCFMTGQRRAKTHTKANQTKPSPILPKDCVLEDGLHGYRVAGPAGPWRHPEEPVLWVDGPELTLRVWAQPRNVVSHHAHLQHNQQ